MQHVPIHITKIYLAKERVNPPISNPIISSQVLDKFQELYITPGSATLTTEKKATRAGSTYIYKVVFNTTQKDVTIIPGIQPVILKTTGSAGYWMQNAIFEEDDTINVEKNLNEITISAQMLTPLLSMFFDGVGGSDDPYIDPIFTSNKVFSFSTTNLTAGSITFSVAVQDGPASSSTVNFSKQDFGELVIKVGDNIHRFTPDENQHTISIPAESNIIITCDNINDDNFNNAGWLSFLKRGFTYFEAENLGINNLSAESEYSYTLFPSDWHGKATGFKFSMLGAALSIDYIDNVMAYLLPIIENTQTYDPDYYIDFSGSTNPIPPQDWWVWDSEAYWNLVAAGATINFNLDYTPTNPFASA